MSWLSADITQDRAPEIREYLMSALRVEELDPEHWDFAGTSVPFTLSLIANLLVAMVAGLMFHFLYRWQYSDPTVEKGVYGRAAWIVLPPIALVSAFLLAFSNVGFWIVGLGLFTLLAGVFTTWWCCAMGRSA